MAVQDLRYDSYYDFIWYSDNGPWSVRFTAWYTIGLLKRNQGDDLVHAKAALRNMYVSVEKEGLVSRAHFYIQHGLSVHRRF